ncbi:hypothetical protein AB4564_09760 [Vibrio sp. 10N.222.51.E8]|uniref:hypothetical protein n=1 Tax=unclassified Vibrio TaxID=2614977 RepID=UPI0010BDB524|nr:hypothetical protein [Vibrio sp. F13]TKG31697.1 hypothetical protein FCV85_11310 [Vibrio sp. F13]
MKKLVLSSLLLLIANQSYAASDWSKETNDLYVAKTEYSDLKAAIIRKDNRVYTALLLNDSTCNYSGQYASLGIEEIVRVNGSAVWYKAYCKDKGVLQMFPTNRRGHDIAVAAFKKSNFVEFNFYQSQLLNVGTLKVSAMGFSNSYNALLTSK